jgi:hypothetical protein
VHDTVDLETRGIPALCVATVEFEDGIRAQARALGADPAAAYVSHPIQDRSDAEMVEIADRAIEAIVAGLVEPAVGEHGSS